MVFIGHNSLNKTEEESGKGSRGEREGEFLIKSERERGTRQTRRLNKRGVLEETDTENSA